MAKVPPHLTYTADFGLRHNVKLDACRSVYFQFHQSESKEVDRGSTRQKPTRRHSARDFVANRVSQGQLILTPIEDGVVWQDHIPRIHDIGLFEALQRTLGSPLQIGNALFPDVLGTDFTSTVMSGIGLGGPEFRNDLLSHCLAFVCAEPARQMPRPPEAALRLEEHREQQQPAEKTSATAERALGFIERLEGLNARGQVDEAIDTVIDVFDAALGSRQFDFCDEILKRLDVTKLDEAIPYAVLAETKPFRRRLYMRGLMFQRMLLHVRRKQDERYAHRLLNGVR
jgi:hypothetical protein